MTWYRVQSYWKQFKGIVEVNHGRTTGDRFQVIEGERDQLVGKVQQAYDISADEVERRFSGRVGRLK